MQPKIFHYTDPRHYLVDTFKFKKEKNPLFSIRALSKQMGFKCHSSLVLFFKGKRQIRSEHVTKIVQGLKITDAEAAYFSSLVSFHNAKNEGEKKHFEEQMKKLSPSKRFSVLELDRFRAVADWYHMAILEMTQLKNFIPSTEWIQKNLFFKTHIQDVQNAVQRLFQLGLMKETSGRWVKTHERLTTPSDFASESIREHHRQVLRNAIDSLESQSVHERIFNSCAMTIDSKKLPEAQNLILKFREEMSRLVSQSEGDETYQLSVSFFKLTNSNQIEERKGLQ